MSAAAAPPAPPEALPWALLHAGGYVRALASGAVTDCPHAGARDALAWLAGFAEAAVSVKRAETAAPGLFHVAPRGAAEGDLLPLAEEARFPRAGADWTRTESRFREAAWPGGLDVADIAALLGRSSRAVRVRAARDGLGARAIARAAADKMRAKAR